VKKVFFCYIIAMSLANYPKIDIDVLLEDGFNRFIERAKHLYHIRTEDNRIVGYEPNEAQIMIDKIRREEFDRTKQEYGVSKCKLIVLKARQVGITTDTACFNSDIALRLKHAHLLILAHEADSTDIIYNKYQTIYNNLPERVIPLKNGDPLVDRFGKPQTLRVKPSAGSNSQKRLDFTDMSESRLVVRTGGSRDNVGRGDTLNAAHISEFSRLPDAGGTLDAINQALPKQAFEYTVIESTANGVSGDGEQFYELWNKSVKAWDNFKTGKSSSFDGFRPVFIPWYVMSKYRHPLVKGQFIDVSEVNFGSDDKQRQFFEREEILRDQYGLDDEQINWYRWCIVTNCRYNYVTALQEYPTFPEDAFLSTDNGVFNNSKLISLRSEYEQNKGSKYITGHLNEELEFVEASYGNLRIWDAPDPSFVNRYVVSLDQSQGSENGDNAVMVVFDRLEQRFAAMWVGQLEEDLLAEELTKLALFYNEAMVIPETNMATVINLIKPEGLLPYTGPIYIDEVRHNGEEIYGHRMDRLSKKLLIDQYLSWIRDNYEKMPDIETINEHITFVRKIKGGQVKMEASSGNKDDRVVGCMLAVKAGLDWEEEIWSVNEDKTDIEFIFGKSHRLIESKPKHSRLGRNDRVVLKERDYAAPRKISKIGHG
jgi:hypothetical protein